MAGVLGSVFFFYSQNNMRLQYRAATQRRNAGIYIPASLGPGGVGGWPQFLALDSHNNMAIMASSLFFIAVLPPKEIQAEVTRFKEYAAGHFHSSRALRSPPHITLISPFQWPEERAEEMMQALGDSCTIGQSVSSPGKAVQPPPDPSDMHRSRLSEGGGEAHWGCSIESPYTVHRIALLPAHKKTSLQKLRREAIPKTDYIYRKNLNLFSK